MPLKAIKYLSVVAVFFFPFALFKNLAFPLTFSHVVFMFTVVEICTLLFLLHSIGKGEITVKKSWLLPALVLYILILFITALTGEEFAYSFWSNYSRATGIITWLHYFSFFAVISAVFSSRDDWKMIFRALALSGGVLALLSFLGRDGVGVQPLAFLKQGGSFLGNTSYSGAYMLLIFFMSAIGAYIEDSRKWRAAYLMSALFIFFNPDLFNFGIWAGRVPFVEALKNPALFFGMARASSLTLWAGTGLFAILFFLNKLKNKKTVVIIATTIAVTILGTYAFAFSSILRQEGKFYELYSALEPSPVRALVWDMALQGVKERPWLGYGHSNFKYVYQAYLDPAIIHLENPPWFDRAHNFTLEEVMGHGILGAAIFFSIFILIVYISLKLYLREQKLYFLFTPFIFILHFLQLQTFFQVDSTLLLSFILLAFLVAQEDDLTLAWPNRKHALTYQFIAIALAVAAFSYFVAMPVKENVLIPKIKNSLSRNYRLELQKQLVSLHVDPVETLRQVGGKFQNDAAVNARAIHEKGLVENVAEEYRQYLNIYEKYLGRYSNYHRFLFEYADLATSAFAFGVDDLKKGEELARQSISISGAYPHPYWVLSVNLYYQGRTEEALEAAKQAYDIDPTIRQSQKIYEFMKNASVTRENIKTFLDLTDI